MTERRHLLDCPDRSNLGRRLTLAPEGAYQALLDVRGDDAAAREVAISLTLAPTLQVEAMGPDDIAANRDELRARALIEAGVGGHVARFELDVGAGVQLSASVSSLRVSAKNLGGAPVDVGAFVGYGGTQNRPTLTRVGEPLAFRETWTLEVPEFARSFEVLRPHEHELLVEVGLGRAGERWLYGERLLFDLRMRPMPLANGCRRVRLTSYSTRRTFRPVVLFHLAL